MEILKNNQTEIVELKNIQYLKLRIYWKDLIVKLPQNNKRSMNQTPTGKCQLSSICVLEYQRERKNGYKR